MGLLTLLLASCAGSPLEFAEVKGQVTLNDTPLAGAIVRFYPISDQKEQLPYATARTDAAGKYRLLRDDDKPGALIGRNRVVVQWPSRDMRQDGVPSGPPPEIPIRYTVVTESPFTFEVKAGKQNIDLRLTE